MNESNQKDPQAPAHDLSSLTTPPARTRDRSADDLEVDITDPNLDLTFDDENRAREDASPTSD